MRICLVWSAAAIETMMWTIFPFSQVTGSLKTVMAASTFLTPCSLLECASTSPSVRNI